MKAWNYLVDVIDNSMSPKMVKGDFVTVFPGFKIENGHMAAVMVTSAVEKSTKLLIRKVVMEERRIILKALNRGFPSFVYKGPDDENIQIIGLVTTLHRYYDGGKVYGPIVIAEQAKKNRMALEQNTGDITFFEMEEIR